MSPFAKKYPSLGSTDRKGCRSVLGVQGRVVDLGLAYLLAGMVVWALVLAILISSIVPSVAVLVFSLATGLLQWGLLSCTGPGHGPPPGNRP